jgi:hypothetical protein
MIPLSRVCSDEGIARDHKFILLWDKTLFYIHLAWIFFMHFMQHCFICRPSDSTVSEDARFAPRTVATLALSVRRSNHSDRSHPHPDKSHPLWIRSVQTFPRLKLIRSAPNIPAETFLYPSYFSLVGPTGGKTPLFPEVELHTFPPLSIW